jgi:hypothetical protein
VQTVNNLVFSKENRKVSGQEDGTKTYTWENITQGTDVGRVDLLATFDPRDGSFQSKDQPFGFAKDFGWFHKGGWDDKADFTFRLEPSEGVSVYSFDLSITDLDHAAHGVATEEFTVLGKFSGGATDGAVSESADGGLTVKSEGGPDGSALFTFEDQSVVEMVYHAKGGYPPAGSGGDFDIMDIEVIDISDIPSPARDNVNTVGIGRTADDNFAITG